jgi:cytochrome c553
MHTMTKTYQNLSFVALLILVIALPIYASREDQRMQRMQQQLKREALTDAAVLYLEQCVDCHGVDGEGVGALPALNNANLESADPALLQRTIANPPHGTAMSAWHAGQGASLDAHQITGLVSLIMDAEWSLVDTLAESGQLERSLPEMNTDLMALDAGEVESENPHECRSCHEEPAVHADRFGLNCSRCHSLDAWKPALLLRHVFHLDHGGQGRIACQTCHTETYSEHTCYGCHDHQPAAIEESHTAEGIVDVKNCATCHPTGVAGEAERLWQEARGEHDVIESATP